ncbi:MAG: DUF1284 domain-containing protein [Thermoplasmata archaeon]|nr:DUF1284 domain-containing protein [Thermoplasmata archaeon]
MADMTDGEEREGMDMGGGRGMDADVLRLRPHHLLCIPRYVGEGYGEDFNRAMARARDFMEAGGMVELVRGEDDICCSCPHAPPHTPGGRYGSGSAEICSTGWVSRLDDLVLRLLALEYGLVERGDVLLSRSRARVPTVKEVCVGCPWLELCLQVEKGWAEG